MTSKLILFCRGVIFMNSQIINKKQDLTYLSWSKIRNSSGTAGSFLKSYSEISGNKIYYKLSNYDNIRGVIGHENVNEIIVDRLLNIIGIDHISYQLINADILVDEKIQETYVCASKNFRKPMEDKLALDVFYEMEHQKGESPLDFCLRMGWDNYIWQMLVVDFLILNCDRHGANIEVLRNKKEKTIRLAPLFDHGLSLLCSCETDEEIKNFDVLSDKQVQCFVGSQSAYNNLNLIPKNQMPKLNPIKESDKLILQDGLDGIISQPLKDKIWDMIWKRWCYYENFCNQR